MFRSQTSFLLTVALLGLWHPAEVESFSLGRLFPASRSGVRGTLISSLTSQKSSASNILKEAVKEVQEEAPAKAKPTVSHQPVTNSPIYYIRLPPAPYVYMPGLGYVSPNTNTFNFVRPDLDFINNGRPSSIYQYKASSTTATTTTTTTTPAPSTTTSSSTDKPGNPNKKPNSSITWLPGSWIFNGRPSNLFIFNSPHNPGHLDALHKKYYKQRVLF